MNTPDSAPIGSREKWQILEGAWIQANATGEFLIPCESRQEAINLRNELYVAARRCTKPKHFNKLVCEIRQTMSITLVEPSTLKVYRRELSRPMQALAGVANRKLEEEAVNSLQRLEKLLAEWKEERE